MISCEGIFDFLFEKQFLPNKRVFFEIFKNVFPWDTFFLLGDSMCFIRCCDKALMEDRFSVTHLNLFFQAYIRNQCAINQGTEQSHYSSYFLNVSPRHCPYFLSGEIS